MNKNDPCGDLEGAEQEGLVSQDFLREIRTIKEPEYAEKHAPKLLPETMEDELNPGKLFQAH